MNLLKKIHKMDDIKIEKHNKYIILENTSSEAKKIVLFHIFKKAKEDQCQIRFLGKTMKGESPELKLVSRKLTVLQSIEFNSQNFFQVPARLFMVAIKIMPYSKVRLNEFEICFNNEINKTVNDYFKGDILLMVPGYPSEKNKYLFGFVHTRVREYKKSGLNIDVAVVTDNPHFSEYIYEDVHVKKISYFDIRNLLQVKQYSKIIVHFFKEEYAQILDATNITDTDVYIFTHGSDILYRDINILGAKYFESIPKVDDKQKQFFECKDKIIQRYNEMPNVKFIFASNWAKDRSEYQNNIQFNNFEVLPTYINEHIFNFEPKKEDLRKKVVIIRKYDNLSTYSIDIAVKAILELSKRDCFQDMEFSIYGDGEYHEVLLAPLRKFKNVKIYKKFLTHDEISNVHKKNGIGLFATRYETQGVSAAEAAMSGLIVVSNDVAAVPEMFDSNFKILAKKEDYVEMANIIERLYNNPREFTELSKKIHESLKKQYGYNNTMKKELKIIKEKLPRRKYIYPELKKEKILTISVAAYNVEKFLRNSMESLITSSVAHKLEILIINDGSKDNTGIIAKELQKLTTVNGDSIVKFIDKENGGHGSTINKGIELASGKYFKMMDGDDYFDTKELEKLVKYLEFENADIVLNNYVEDLSVPCNLNPIRHYEFLEPGKTYRIEDLCYEGYGFSDWGPLLSTSTFKTQILKNANFLISEHCFYVDMELNAIAFANAKTVTYYPLDIYIYYLGRVGQSISAASFKKNYKHHETVTLRIIKDIYLKYDLSDEKRMYLKNKIILPLIKAQYYIVSEYFKSGKFFKEFDDKLKSYEEFYNDPFYVNKRIKLYRMGHGKFIGAIKFLVKIKHLFLGHKD